MAGLEFVRTNQQLRIFLGMVQFYRDMWKRRSHILAHLIYLEGVGKKKLKWTEVLQKAFGDVQKVMAKETIITYPNFNEVFEIYTDASDR